jgi:hypothetical protein
VRLCHWRWHVHAFLVRAISRTVVVMMPKLIAPDLDCVWCVAQMREPTLMGQALVSLGRATIEAQQLLAGRLHELRYHVHCDMPIGDREYWARAHIALPLLVTPTVVMCDVQSLGASHLGLTTNRCASDRRMHWADDVSQGMKFARVGWRVIRIREAGLEPTSPLDLTLPRPIAGGRDNDALLRLATQHVLGIVEANVAAA